MLSGWFSSLRALAFLRRCARALERSAVANEETARIARAWWRTQARGDRPKARKTEFDTMDLAEVSADWRKARIAAGADPDELEP